MKDRRSKNFVGLRAATVAALALATHASAQPSNGAFLLAPVQKHGETLPQAETLQQPVALTVPLPPSAAQEFDRSSPEGLPAAHGKALDIVQGILGAEADFCGAAQSFIKTVTPRGMSDSESATSFGHYYFQHLAEHISPNFTGVTLTYGIEDHRYSVRGFVRGNPMDLNQAPEKIVATAAEALLGMPREVSAGLAEAGKQISGGNLDLEKVGLAAAGEALTLNQIPNTGVGPNIARCMITHMAGSFESLAKLQGGARVIGKGAAQLDDNFGPAAEKSLDTLAQDSTRTALEKMARSRKRTGQLDF